MTLHGQIAEPRQRARNQGPEGGLGEAAGAVPDLEVDQGRESRRKGREEGVDPRSPLGGGEVVVGVERGRGELQREQRRQRQAPQRRVPRGAEDDPAVQQQRLEPGERSQVRQTRAGPRGDAGDGEDSEGDEVREKVQVRLRQPGRVLTIYRSI